MSNVVFTVNIKNPENPGRCRPYELSIDSWKVWAEKNNCEVFILDQWVYDKEVMNPNWHKLLVFDLLENSGIDYDQVLIVDSDTFIHPDAPNIFDETDNKFCAVHNDGSYDWVLRSMETYSKFVFEDYMFDWSEYFNSGVMVVNKEHKSLFKDILTFYLTNQELVTGLQKNFGVGTDQPMINFFVHKNNIDLKLLPYKWNMQDLHRKEILNEDMLFTKLGWVYHFNAIPNNYNSYMTLYWLQKTTQYFDNDDEFIIANRVQTNVWNEFLDSMDEEYDTWRPDYQSTSADEFAEMVSYLHEGASPPLFLMDKSTNKIVAYFHVNFCGVGSEFIPDNEYYDKLLYLHSYVVKKEHQRKGLAKKYLKIHIDWLDTVGVGYKDGEAYTYDIFTERGKYLHIPLLHKSVYHYARTNLKNYGSRNLCKSLGFKELKGTENNDRVEYILETKL